MKTRHIVIVGGGFAGIATAKELENADVDITLIDKSNHHLFQPLLYQVATAALSPGDIAAPLRAIVGKNPRLKVLLGEVLKIEAENNSLQLLDGRTVHFDQLVLAPGSHYNYFGHPEWAAHAPGLKTISDALSVRERILQSLEEAEQLEDPKLRQPFLTFVVIGGGPTGVEMAGAISEIVGKSMRQGFRNLREEEKRVYLLEASPEILNNFPESLGANGRRMLEDLGVKVLRETPVMKIEKNKVYLKVGAIDTPNIIWAAGIKASPLLDTLKVEQDRMGRVVVNSDLSIPVYPNIFVLGDAAHLEEEKGKTLPALASVAKQQGHFLGSMLAQKDFLLQPRAVFRYGDKGTMATIGRARAVASVKGMKFSGSFAWFLWSAVHILILVGFRNRTRVFLEWMWNYFTFKRGVQLITDRTTCNHCKSGTPVEISKSV